MPTGYFGVGSWQVAPPQVFGLYGFTTADAQTTLPAKVPANIENSKLLREDYYSIWDAVNSRFRVNLRNPPGEKPALRLRCKELAEGVQDGVRGFRIEFPQTLHQPGFVHRPDLVERNLANLTLKFDFDRVGQWRRTVVMGAMMTVATARFSSSGETTTHGRVLAVSAPVVGSRRTRKM